MPDEKRPRKASSRPRTVTVPVTLPCSCRSVTGGTAKAVRLEDGSRICFSHGRRWQLTFVEVQPQP